MTSALGHEDGLLDPVRIRTEVTARVTVTLLSCRPHAAHGR